MILQWLLIEFGGGVVYENTPPATASLHWSPIYHTLHERRVTRAGGSHAISMFYHTETIAVWAD